MEKSYRFLPYFFAAFFVVVIYCFYQSYFGQFPYFKNVISPIGNVPIKITSVTHFHAIIIVIWLLMLILQPILILKKQLKWHRIIGKASYLVVALLFISLLMIVSQEQTKAKNLPVFAANLFDIPVFMVFYCLAIYFRKKPAYHARFMVMSVLPFINPALARANIAGVPVQLALWILLFLIEFFTRKTYKPYLIGLGYYVFNLLVVAYLFMANPALLEKFWKMIWG
jgi:hypothetical protein